MRSSIPALLGVGLFVAIGACGDEAAPRLAPTAPPAIAPPPSPAPAPEPEPEPEPEAPQLTFEVTVSGGRVTVTWRGVRAIVAELHRSGAFDDLVTTSPVPVMGYVVALAVSTETEGDYWLRIRAYDSETWLVRDEPVHVDGPAALGTGGGSNTGGGGGGGTTANSGGGGGGSGPGTSTNEPATTEPQQTRQPTPRTHDPANNHTFTCPNTWGNQRIQMTRSELVGVCSVSAHTNITGCSLHTTTTGSGASTQTFLLVHYWVETADGRENKVSECTRVTIGQN